MAEKLQPAMTPDEFSAAQKALDLSDDELAFLLGFENPQHIRRLRAPVNASHAKRVMPATARLLTAYLSGYRPDDWPETKPTAGPVINPETGRRMYPDATPMQRVTRRLNALELAVFGKVQRPMGLRKEEE